MGRLVSVILPTYNVEKYLSNCLDTIVSQSYKNIEVIIVIDGSNDKSLDIAKEYSLKDSRVRVIWQENTGSGPARNNGLYHASGEYVVFVDPDDWVDSRMIESFVEAMERTGADLLTSPDTHVYFDDNNHEISRKKRVCKERLFDTEELVRKNYYSLYSHHLLGSPTKKMYRLSLIRNYNICFPDLRRSQDIVFNYRYYQHCKSVYVYDESFYYYRINLSSSILKLPFDYYKTVLLIHNGILDMYTAWGQNPSDIEMLGYNNIFLDRIERCLEARIAKGESITDIILDEDVNSIVCKSKPSRIDKKFVKFAVLTKNKSAVRLILLIKNLIRRIKLICRFCKNG